jgi:group I intron endonuclease
MISIVRNYIHVKSPISHKYLNHGRNVPIQKCYNTIFKRNYSTNNVDNNEKNLSCNTSPHLFTPLKFYENALDKKQIVSDNLNKSGIYFLTNLITSDIYVGQSINLGKRLGQYLTLSYLEDRNNLIISRALVKYGYINFSISILEYCDKPNLTEKEQDYINLLNPTYNILKVAGSLSGYKHSLESRDKRSKSLKGMYVGIKSSFYGKTHTEKTKEIMSLDRQGIDNYFYGKTHSEETKQLMRQKALNRKHSAETLEKMAKVRGNPVNIYETNDKHGFVLIGNFISARKAGLFLNISGSTIIKYMHSGEVFKERYKFSSK